MTPFAGGQGGSPFLLSCPAGEDMVGLSFRVTNVLTAIRPMCARVWPWFSAGTGGRGYGSFAGGSSGTEGAVVCPAGQFASGIDTTDDGSTITSIQLVCRSPG
jgi:hypothetical protein